MSLSFSKLKFQLNSVTQRMANAPKRALMYMPLDSDRMKPCHRVMQVKLLVIIVTRQAQSSNPHSTCQFFKLVPCLELVCRVLRLLHVAAGASSGFQIERLSFFAIDRCISDVWNICSVRLLDVFHITTLSV